MFKKFFAKIGTAVPYRLFSKAHAVLVSFSAICIARALRKNRYADEQRVILSTRRCAVFLWALEIMKILYNLLCGNAGNPNTYIPLYFCSIPLYCLPMSGWGKGMVKRLGDVFLVVGGLVGGIVYFLSPITTAGMYPAFHFITLQSYILHGVMIYIALLYLVTNHYRPIRSDWKYYAAVVMSVCILARIVNYHLGTNLMFVSKNFPGTPMEILYNFSPKAFPVFMTLIQAFPPFFVVCEIVHAVLRHQNNDAEESI